MGHQHSDDTGGDLPAPGVPEDGSRAGGDQPSAADLEALVAAQADRIAQLEAIIELAPVGIGIVDLEGRAPITNDTLRRLLGYSAEEFARMPFSEFSHPVDNEENLRLFARLAAGEIERFAMEKRFFRADGEVLWSALTVSLMRDADGSPAYAIGMIQDISERRALEDDLRAAERHYRLLVERVPAVVYTAEVGATGRWHYVSPQIERLLGFTPQEWTAREGLWLDRIVEEDRDRALSAEDRVGVTTGSPSLWVTYRMRHRDGSIVWVRDAAVARPGRGGAVVLNGVLVDVTQEKILEEALAWQAVHDPLTGLVNRAHFRERLDEALLDPRSDGTSVAVLFVDLDGFKAVNDTLGHGPGDDVLAAVAGRFAAVTPAGCTLARLGGDEFALLVRGRWCERLEELAGRLITSLGSPVEVQGGVVQVGVSIGGTVAGPADTTDLLLHHADQAMYRAKAEGGARLVLHAG
ncbi:diguanylate cyclase domain-containing protein [Actinotalea sp. K2]|uniref:diguanylate cyclase domain-containing protein n=1 Tax=Actinotalea sp. K2 TaxID=2939438 RepID=UPI002016D7A4|nr:diguanylate cyclase [Actinotalea sp. K2]MCL3862469.1 diguanylate cyclase [Actinotalea sp. K2]